jgi:hypothetical protein
MTAFDHLERELCLGVQRVHASAAASRRPWRPAILALAAALALTAAALAATGTIRIGHTHVGEPNLKPRPHVFAGVRAGPAKTLALRVADPAGGPPWTLRVFNSSRGGHCVQIGQVVRGHFGVFVPPGTLEPLNAWPEGDSSLCSGVARNGFPVVRGLERILVIGGGGDPRRCPARPNGDCPITSVTLLRYGLLGPAARLVRLVDRSARLRASSHTSPRIGGAYLFALSLPVAPYVAANRSERTYGVAFQRAVRAARARGLSLERALAIARRSAPRPTFVRPPDLAVVATFAGGQTLRVAGHNRSPGTLPGVGRHRGYAAPPPRRVPVAVRIERPGRFAIVTLSFTAPVAIRRFDISYTQTLRGPIGLSCKTGGNGYNATTRDIAKGETVRFTLRRPRGARENGREGWCRGRFTGLIRYSVPGRNVTIGRFAFRIR